MGPNLPTEMTIGRIKTVKIPYTPIHLSKTDRPTPPTSTSGLRFLPWGTMLLKTGFFVYTINFCTTPKERMTGCRCFFHPHPNLSSPLMPWAWWALDMANPNRVINGDSLYQSRTRPVARIYWLPGQCPSHPPLPFCMHMGSLRG